MFLYALTAHLSLFASVIIAVRLRLTVLCGSDFLFEFFQPLLAFSLIVEIISLPLFTFFLNITIRLNGLVELRPKILLYPFTHAENETLKPPLLQFGQAEGLIRNVSDTATPPPAPTLTSILKDIMLAQVVRKG